MALFHIFVSTQPPSQRRPPRSPGLFRIWIFVLRVSELSPANWLCSSAPQMGVILHNPFRAKCLSPFTHSPNWLCFAHFALLNTQPRSHEDTKDAERRILSRSVPISRLSALRSTPYAIVLSYPLYAVRYTLFSAVFCILYSAFNPFPPNHKRTSRIPFNLIESGVIWHKSDKATPLWQRLCCPEQPTVRLL